MKSEFSEQNSLTVYRFPNLSGFTEIHHGVFTRMSGFSKGSFQGLNVSTTVGDDPDHTAGNRRAISGYFDGYELVFIRQVHGSDIVLLKKNQKHGPSIHDEKTGDAMITNIPGKILVVQVADCQPVLLFDPGQKVVAAVHSGWRGSLLNIIGKTVLSMADHFDCDPEQIIAGIGPSLGPCCAEFIHYRKEIPECFWKYQKTENHFDFWELSLDQLQEAGVRENNIHISGLCTKCRHDLFFSYRKQPVTGRFAGAIGLKTEFNRS